MTLRLITPPAVEPVDLDLARNQCRVDGTDEDNLIGLFIKAARARVEAFTRRRLVTQTVEARFRRLAKSMPLQTGPVQSIVSVTYLDPDGVEQTLDPSLFRLTDGQYGAAVIPARLVDWPSSLDDDDSVAIRFVAGYGLAEAVPQDLVVAVLMTIGHLYENRESVIVGGTPLEVPQGVRDMMTPHILWF